METLEPGNNGYITDAIGSVKGDCRSYKKWLPALQSVVQPSYSPKLMEFLVFEFEFSEGEVKDSGQRERHFKADVA